jgi:hypothetical protein
MKPTAQSGGERKILVLAANPKRTKRLSLDVEVKAIDESLMKGKQGRGFRLVQKWVVSDESLRHSLLEEEPEIVHFSGHGSGEDGLVFEDTGRKPQLIAADALADLFALCAHHVQCVILNACLSEVQAEAISQHIPFVIGMSSSIGDDAATAFSKGFYDALAAGRSFEDAFRFGTNAIDLKKIPQHLVPILKKKMM